MEGIYLGNNMKYLFLILLGLILNLSCLNKSKKSSDTKESSIQLGYSYKGNNQDKIEDSINSFLSIVLKEDKNKSYAETKAEIKIIRSKIDPENITTDSLSNLFTDLLLNQVMPYWYGTKWSFEGYTSIPKQGEIACGYLVSTTLRDIGINVNRYRLAQQSPLSMAKTINIDKPVSEISSISIDENIIELKKILKEGIYLIGFDQSHVGYILKRQGELYLIHSNYFDSRRVEIERIEKSLVFLNYNRFYIAEISTNKSLINKWLLNEKIEVITN